MKNLFKTIALCSAFAFGSQAQAFGAGLNLGWYDGEADEDSLSGDRDVDHQEFGFVLDTAKRGHKFSYRLNLNFLDGEIDGVNYEGWAMNHTFAVPLTRGGPARFWLGPTVSVNGIDYDSISDDELAVGFGLSAGLDLFATESVAIGFEVGVRRIEYDADRDDGIPFMNDREYEATELHARVVMLFGRF